ncbi:VOC family protein [Shouchella patagoniensis]|uniref:VOC family protein n=1 Tax=Shouchella patagoniensis TaxID=228576 RepID=UPI00099499E3|nr:VOC family protein [Shouchella patagoniensis]
MQFLRLDHIAYVVDEFECSLPIFEKALQVPASSVETVPGQRVDVVFLKSDPFLIEIVRPHVGNRPLQRFLKKRRSPCLHHVAFSVSDLITTIRYLEKENYKFIQTTPQTGSSGREICFLEPSCTNGVLIELCKLPDVKLIRNSAMINVIE